MKTWTCRRKFQGKQCLTTNPSRKRTCQVCGKAKPKKRVPAHMRVLAEMPYDAWIAKYGETCNICGARQGTRRLQRDHDHGSGRDRGILCVRCNRALPAWMTPAWLRTAADYLERSRP